MLTKETCTGGTHIVTGSRTGIGFEAAKYLVTVGTSRVIIAVIFVEKGEVAKSQIEGATGITGVAQVWQLDLASIDSIKAFSERATSELGTIDAYVENATADFNIWSIRRDG
ncbi:short-chain dehydrogenase reductase family [Colletotrichum incanum]|uniref:Short-chain dehydrogenase reductase family n=1 Tax=Colletotrichum incanum TaxID=1573173 RepID=A0A162PQE3_COLIC|nr:short-chain dehydrogenase reductase family [Colletotrichum incanum]OHW93447.1 short-chain dehydrogenase reductase [Colletotrichum incanum]